MNNMDTPTTTIFRDIIAKVIDFYGYRENVREGRIVMYLGSFLSVNNPNELMAMLRDLGNPSMEFQAEMCHHDYENDEFAGMYLTFKGVKFPTEG